MSNSEKMPIYKIARPTLGLIYRLWYNPKIIGKENIPKEGPILLVGNHIHIMDQCNVIISTKRCIHYMAKKEYFDKQYKEGKFPWFFRGAGCIPVDRSKKDEEATASALEVLHEGKALGLFPEGTRNKVKEERAKELYEKYHQEDKIEFEKFSKLMNKTRTSIMNYLEELKDRGIVTEEEFLDNLLNGEDFMKDLVINHRVSKEEYYDHCLLPLKFGAVSMAHKTNAKLVPYAITGDYKLRSKNLTIRIGEPLEVEDDLEKANKELDQAIKDLMKENEKKEW